ncbi:hypothetical protein EOD39_18246 [Acipenser ruthenus]|uniref:Uncharacterized protein n=1 Tax=Acipenser ruthenus TaxID=7906 RepID=A0A444V1E1_ACIRT|nr:hypothetical protein EOD39_18246 [Acipenser ruthenus]
MEHVASSPPASSATDFHRRAVKVTTGRGASSHFVGSSIAILSSYAVTTLAMNRAKKMSEKKTAALQTGLALEN